MFNVVFFSKACMGNFGIWLLCMGSSFVQDWLRGGRGTIGIPSCRQEQL